MSHDDPQLAIDEQDAILRDAVARQFPGSRIDGDSVDLGFLSLKIHCRIDTLRRHDSVTLASLFFSIDGPEVLRRPVFASLAGYGGDIRSAIHSGATSWAAGVRDVLTAALSKSESGAQRFNMSIDGGGVNVCVADLSRAVTLDGKNAPTHVERMKRLLIGDSTLSRMFLESSACPIIDSSLPTILSVLVVDTFGQRRIEIKINGSDWPDSGQVFKQTQPEQSEVIVSLREFAMIVPHGSASSLSRPGVERTLIGFDAIPRLRTAWPGWRRHRGRIGEAISERNIARLESKIGYLPGDYRHFLREVGGSGAGPGYGLVSANHMDQLRLASGVFDPTIEEGPLGGVLVLAHAGCGIMWLLVLTGPHRGEVWVDARSGDGTVRKVAASFEIWYRDWLASSLYEGDPWIQWDSSVCATANSLDQFAEKLLRSGVEPASLKSTISKQLTPEAVVITTFGTGYVAETTPLNPCQGCVDFAAAFGWGPELFLAGVEPFT